MRRYAVLFAMVLGVAVACAHAADTHANFECSYNTQYDVQIQPDGIAFTRDHGTPSDVFMHNGQLRVDGQNVSVSSADAARLRDYEQQVRELVPTIAAIARDGVNIGYSALSTVVATFAENSDERLRYQQQLHDKQVAALQLIETGLDKGNWKVDDDDRAFGADMQQTVADMTGDVVRNVVADALSGDSSRMATLQARTSSLQNSLQKALTEPAKQLALRAQEVCPRLTNLDHLQQQFQFRLANGERLQLLSSDTDSLDKARQYAHR
jgi:cysteinyl-tRNA synthetase